MGVATICHVVRKNRGRFLGYIISWIAPTSSMSLLYRTTIQYDTENSDTGMCLTACPSIQYNLVSCLYHYNSTTALHSEMEKSVSET